MRNSGLDEAQTGIKITGRNTNNLRQKRTQKEVASAAKPQVKENRPSQSLKQAVIFLVR